MKRGVNAIITDDQNKVLVMKRSLNEEFFPGFWDLPGGGVENEESLKEAVKREAEEESGFEVEPEGNYFYLYRHPKGRVDIYAFRMKIIGGEIRLNEEHTEFKWVSKEDCELLEYTPSVTATLKELFK